VSELSTISEKWEDLGRQLGLEYALNEIRTQYSEPVECLKGLIERWLQLHYRFFTWDHIVLALKSPNIGESRLGDHLKEKYILRELIGIHCCLLGSTQLFWGFM